MEWLTSTFGYNWWLIAAVVVTVIIALIVLIVVLKRRKEKLMSARHSANIEMAEVRKFSEITKSRIKGVEEINETVKAKEFAEMATLAIKNMDIAMSEMEQSVSKARMTSSPKIAEEASVQVTESSKKAKIESEKAIDAAGKARSEKNEKVHAEKTAQDATKNAQESFDGILSDVKKANETSYIMEEAKASIENMKSSTHTAEKALAEANKLTTEAKNSTSLEETQSLSTQAVKSAEMALSKVQLIKGAIVSANIKESEYNTAVGTINEALAKAKEATERSLSAFTKAEESVNISDIAGETAAKAKLAYNNSSKLTEEIAELVTNIKILTSSMQARSVASKAKDLVQKAVVQANIAKNAQETVTLIQDAENGNAVAQRQLSELYRQGKDPFNKDINESVKWLEKAAANNDLDSQVELACLYCNGADSFQPDIKKGLYWANKVGDKDKRIASLLVRFHIDGTIRKEPDDLFNFYEDIFKKHKEPLALIALGELYCSGQGTRVNPKKGLNHIEEGMKHYKEPLSPIFCLRLGMLYAEGKTSESGSPNLEGALPLLKKATALGDNKLIAFVNEVEEQLKRIKLENELRTININIEWRGNECIGCRNKTEKDVYTSNGRYFARSITCPYGYSETILNGNYEGNSRPGDQRCPKFTKMFNERDRLQKMMKALDDAPSLQ